MLSPQGGRPGCIKAQVRCLSYAGTDLSSAALKERGNGVWGVLGCRDLSIDVV